MPAKREQKYMDILCHSIRVCQQYKPKLGYGKREGYSLEEFRQLYQRDPFYSWIGLDDPLMYAAHKAAGGMTSIYRQIGIGCEKVFRAVLQDTLNLSEEESTWYYTIPSSGGKTRRLSLDGRIPLEAIKDHTRHAILSQWIYEACRRLDVERELCDTIKGLVFEVRQGYKSKDSKRQNADIANAATAYTQCYLPCVAILSQQIDQDIALRYTTEKWVLLTGTIGEVSVHESIYAFMRNIVGYDLAGFFERHKTVLKQEVHAVLTSLLATK